MTDVCLILEGTYPFVSGGVSTWIHQLISAMSDLRFSILYLSPFPNPRREYKYELPPNLVDIQDLFLHDYSVAGPTTNRRFRREAFPRIKSLHQDLFKRRWQALAELVPLLRGPKQSVTPRDIFESRESWEALVELYSQYGEKASFLDFFWTWRSIYLPLVKAVTAPIPKAQLYHTVSTGYAGLVAAIAKLLHGRRMLLTEHGVYTHERMLEIAQASWIYSPQRDRFRIQRELPFFKRFWLGFFESLGGISYHFADSIITLFEGNRTREILGGANPEKITIIPNGIDLGPYRAIRRTGPSKSRPKVAYIGRVVPIKDVKTFLHACKLITQELPEADFLVIGPMDEESEYAAECRQLALDLDLKVLFTGKVNVRDYYRHLDVVVLTSLSEAQPYVLIEANAAGVPVVATDVGACREMIEGRLSEDRELGLSGLLTSVANPEATAQAALKILKNPELWFRLSEAGRARVFRFYDQNDLLGQYLNLYERSMQ